MTDITGLWQMNASGSVGTMYIASIDGQGNLTGKITFVDAPRADTLMKATWNDATGSIYFERWIGNDPNNLFKQFFTGYLGDNHPDHDVIEPVTDFLLIRAVNSLNKVNATLSQRGQK